MEAEKKRCRKGEEKRATAKRKTRRQNPPILKSRDRREGTKGFGSVDEE